MIMEPLFHLRTKTQLDNYLMSPSHGLLLTGPDGSGKLFTAKWIAETLAADLLIIAATESKTAITIEQIRELYSITRTGKKLVAVIKEAHNMSKEAQNAFLKLLEEPPKNTIFILTATSSEALLSTIKSRSQQIEILPSPVKALLEIDTELAPEEVMSLLHTTQQLTGKFSSLLKDEDLRRDWLDKVSEAKKFYSTSPYKRHLLCIEYKYDRKWALELLQILAVIVHSLLKQGTSTPPHNKRLLKQAKLIESTAQNLTVVNGNPKIHLTKLCERLD